MAPTLLTALLTCSGSLLTFETQLSFDIQNRSVQGTLEELTDERGSFPVNIQGLSKDGSCMNSPELKICFSENLTSGMVEMYVPDEGGLILEKGQLHCQEKSRLKKPKRS